MYDILGILDSPDIREFHKDTIFTPAEQAVLAAKSTCKSLQDKVAVLEQLAEKYNVFATENVQSDFCGDTTPFRDALANTIMIWKGTLEDRWDSEGCVFAETLIEKDCIRYDFSDYQLYSTYQKAYDALVMRKQEYMEDDDLNRVETFGIIKRIRLDREHICEDEYRFNNEMQLIMAFANSERTKHLEKTCLLDEYNIYIPLPFRKGDLVIVKPAFGSTYYGVVPADFEKPGNGIINTFATLDIYNAETQTFDYTDDTDVLEMEFCREEELPEEQQILKQIRKVRTGEMDFYMLLHQYGKGSV